MAGFLLRLPQSIAWRLVILVAAALLPAFGFAAFVADRLADGERAGYRLQLLATARALSLAIDRDMASQQATVRALAGSPSLLDGDLQAFYLRAKEVLDGDADRRIVLFDATGQQIVNTFFPYGHKLPASNFNWAIKRVFATGQPQSSNLIVGAATGRPTVGVYVPVFRDGKVVFALAMGFSAERISRILHDQRMPAGWIAKIADREGVILAHNRTQHLIGERVPADAWPSLGSESEGLGAPMTKDEPAVRGAFARSPVTNWTTMVAVDTAILEAPLKRSLWWLAAGGALLLLLAAGGSILYGRRIAGPITELTRMAVALGRGEPLDDRRLALPEARVVADQMRLTGQMLDYRNRERENLLATLERRVADRTQALAESEARYRLLADNASDMIFHAGTDQVLSYASPSCRVVLGYAPEEIAAQRFNDLMHPDDVDGLVRALRGMHPGAERETSSFRMRRKDGAYIWVEASCTLLVDPVSAARSYIAVVRDVTRRVEAEERARQAAMRAEAANEAKSSFLASMSHELRTPLSVVTGFAQLLLNSRKDPPSEHQREFLGHIQQAGQQLQNLISDVLDLARIESGRVSVTIESVDLKEVVETFAALLGPMAEEKDIGIQVRPWRTKVAAIRADRARLLQVLLNLGSNAIKYNRPGGMVVIEIERAKSGRVQISVADTGIGIPVERQAHVFELFNRLGAEKSGVEGTGIGLAICKRLVDRMQGRIAFSSDPDWGSRFWVEFPADHSVTECASKTTDTVTPEPLPSCTVLHIEDQPAAAILVRQLAQSVANVRALTAKTGEEGVALAREHRPDIIITDIRLPDISGYEVLRRLNATPETSGIPIIALSAEAMKSDVSRGRDAGFAHYMTKPFVVGELFAVMRRLIESRAA